MVCLLTRMDRSECSDGGSVDCCYHYDSSDMEEVAPPVWECPACDFADNSPYDAECSLCLVQSPTESAWVSAATRDTAIQPLPNEGGQCCLDPDCRLDHLTLDSVRRGVASLSLGHGGGVAAAATAEAVGGDAAIGSPGGGLEFEFPPYLLEVRAPPSALETIAEDVFAEICRFLGPHGVLLAEVASRKLVTCSRVRL